MTVRFARPVSNVRAAAEFYETVLGLKRLAAFEDHSGYSGVIFGPDGDGNWQVEIVSKVGRARSDCSCELVLYCDASAFDRISERVKRASIEPVENENPYWSQRGAVTIRDPDGGRIVIVRGPAVHE